MSISEPDPKTDPWPSPPRRLLSETIVPRLPFQFLSRRHEGTNSAERSDPVRLGRRVRRQGPFYRCEYHLEDRTTARLTGMNRQSSAMKMRDFTRDSQAQATAAGRASWYTVKALENPRALFLWYSRPVVFHGNHDVGGFREPHGYIASVRGSVSQCVVDKIV